MLGWLKRLFRKAPADPGERLDVYDPGERLIFRYFAGNNTYGNPLWVDADPMLLYRRVMDVGPQLDADMAAVQVPASKFSAAAYANLVRECRAIFAVGSLNEGGLTDLEVVDLLHCFMTFCGSVKKNARSTATSPATTPPSSPSPTSAAGAPATSGTSASGSAVTASRTAGPTPSPSGSGSGSGPTGPGPGTGPT